MGRLEYKNGDKTYTGQFKNGREDGQGMFKYQNGLIKGGRWTDGQWTYD